MSDLKGEFVEMKLSDIVPYDRNPRINKDAVDRVLQSLKEHGQVRPLVLSAPGKPFEKPVVCCGHTTLKALKKFGAKTAKVQLHAFESEKQFVDYNIRDNKTSEFAEWDETVLLELANDFQIDLKELEFEFDMEHVDYSALDDVDDEEANDLQGEVRRSIKIDFSNNDYEEAKKLVDEARSRDVYIGGELIAALKK